MRLRQSICVLLGLLRVKSCSCYMIAEQSCETESDLDPINSASNSCTLDMLQDAELQRMLLKRGYDGADATRDDVISALQTLLEEEQMLSDLKQDVLDIEEVEEGDYYGRDDVEIDEGLDEPLSEEVESQEAEEEPNTAANEAPSSDIPASGLKGFMREVGSEVWAQIKRDLAVFRKVVEVIIPKSLMPSIESGVSLVLGTAEGVGRIMIRDATAAARVTGRIGKSVQKQFLPQVKQVRKLAIRIKDKVTAAASKLRKDKPESRKPPDEAEEV